MAKKRKQAKKPAKRGKSAGVSKPKRIVEVIIRKKVLGEAPVEKHFVVADGGKLKSVVELAKALEHMSDEVFRHHVSEARNDFSSWVRDVFEEYNLADELSKAKDRLSNEVILLRKIIKELL